MPEIKPYNQKEEKSEQVERMFDAISPRYDFLNRLLSLGFDQRWRKQLLKEKEVHVSAMLDIATGTGDIAIMAAQMFPDVSFQAMDLSAEMLKLAQIKVEKKGLAERIKFKQGKAESLPYPDHSFDLVTCGFGVRNFHDLNQGLTEIYRILKPGGQVLILEFSQPKKFPFAQAYQFYFKYVLPLIGRIISKDRKAYSYLYESSMAFPAYEKFCNLLLETGFFKSRYKSLTLGICCIYSATK